MSRSTLVRLQLLILGVLVVSLGLWRMQSDGADAPTPPPPPAEVPSAPTVPREPAMPAPPPPELASADVLLRLAPLGNDVDTTVTFSLDAPTPVRLIAVGEVGRDGAYDHGYLQRADGTRIWALADAPTYHAGGAYRNRRFDDTLRLAPGTYTVAFQTDFSHAYGDFADDSRPDRPEAWGLMILRAE